MTAASAPVSGLGAGTNVTENRKIGLYKERLKAWTGYAFSAFGVRSILAQDCAGETSSDVINSFKL